MMDKIKQFKQTVKNQGLSIGVNRSFRYYSPLHEYNMLNYDTYQNKRVDNEERLELIKKELDVQDRSLLDIGCADGFFISELAKEGLFCIGVERKKGYVKYSRQKYASNDNIGIINTKLTGENVKSIPEFDVVLLLTVYHHFPPDEAEEMLRVIASKTNKIFFEIYSGHPEQKTSLETSSFNTNEAIEFWPEYFKYVLNDSVSVKHIGETQFKSNERTDVHFLIDTCDYQCSNL